MLIDAHTHLDHSEADAERLVDEAVRDGVGPHHPVGHRPRVVALRGRPGRAASPRCSAAWGSIPRKRVFSRLRGWRDFEELAAHERVVAVGETGFDFYHDNWPHDVQEEVFIRHLDLARAAGLPVVVHTRDAAEQTLRVLDEHAAGLTVILHCFSLTGQLAEVLDRGYYMSFAGNVTYKSATDLQEACRRAPHDRLLLETDAPYLTPVPLRGRPNRPALVAKTYDFVAGLRDVDLEQLAVQVEANARRAFPRLGKPAGRSAMRPDGEEAEAASPASGGPGRR